MKSEEKCFLAFGIREVLFTHVSSLELQNCLHSKLACDHIDNTDDFHDFRSNNSKKSNELYRWFVFFCFCFFSKIYLGRSRWKAAVHLTLKAGNQHTFNKYWRRRKKKKLGLTFWSVLRRSVDASERKICHMKIENIPSFLPVVHPYILAFGVWRRRSTGRALADKNFHCKTLVDIS